MLVSASVHTDVFERCFKHSGRRLKLIHMLTETWWANRITKTVTKQYSSIRTAVLHQTNTLNVCLHSFAEGIRIKDEGHAAGISCADSERFGPWRKVQSVPRQEEHSKLKKLFLTIYLINISLHYISLKEGLMYKGIHTTSFYTLSDYNLQCFYYGSYMAESRVL